MGTAVESREVTSAEEKAFIGPEQQSQQVSTVYIPSTAAQVQYTTWRKLYLRATTVLFLLALWYRIRIATTVCRLRAVHHQSALPAFAFTYAPLVWLAEDEDYFPADMAAQVLNAQARRNYTVLAGAPDPLTLENMDKLNNLSDLNGTDIFLTSLHDVTTVPTYLKGVRPDAYRHTTNITSCAIISVAHPTNTSITHIFYMYFYAFNQGNTVFGQELGDHVGDWEHSMIRFVDGKPTQIWFSQHWNGEAFVYPAVEKIDGRPVVYSARGSHANYATAGTHDHLIPDVDGRFGLLEDHASRGALWDPVLSAYEYTYDILTDQFEAADAARQSPLGAMLYRGQWGDQEYPLDDPRQKQFFGFRKYVSGPNGPRWKGLDRPSICPVNGFYCIIRKGLGRLSEGVDIDAIDE